VRAEFVAAGDHRGQSASERALAAFTCACVAAIALLSGCSDDECRSGGKLSQGEPLNTFFGPELGWAFYDASQTVTHGSTPFGSASLQLAVGTASSHWLHARKGTTEPHTIVLSPGAAELVESGAAKGETVVLSYYPANDDTEFAGYGQPRLLAAIDSGGSLRFEDACEGQLVTSVLDDVLNRFKAATGNQESASEFLRNLATNEQSAEGSFVKQLTADGNPSSS
jgi:hypothetical protein